MDFIDKVAQIKRFEILSQIGNLNGTTILDAGCGNGGFWVYLSQHFSGLSYRGFDIMSSFLDNAIERTKSIPNTHFYLADFMAVDLPQVDYVFASGLLHYKNTDPDFIYKALTRLFSACQQGFAFTLLSSTPNQDGILCAYDPLVILNFCKSLSENIQMIEGYEVGEFAVFIRI